MDDYTDTRSKRDRQADKAFTRFATRIAVVVVIILSVVFYLRYSSNVEGPEALLSLTIDNYHDTTSIIMSTDLKRVEEHLDALSDELPEYVELVKVVSDKGFTKCVSVKFAMSTEELKRYYFTSQTQFNEAMEELKKHGIMSGDEDLDKILGDA